MNYNEGIKNGAHGSVQVDDFLQNFAISHVENKKFVAHSLLKFLFIAYLDSKKKKNHVFDSDGWVQPKKIIYRLVPLYLL